MLTVKTVDEHILELSHTASDLLVGLQCLDTPEVRREAMLLKEQANKYGAVQLAITAHNIELAATAENLDAARLLIPELQSNLQQAQTPVAEEAWKILRRMDRINK